jgi:hypothetical protein
MIERHACGDNNDSDSESDPELALVCQDKIETCDSQGNDGGVSGHCTHDEIQCSNVLDSIASAARVRDADQCSGPSGKAIDLDATP